MRINRNPSGFYWCRLSLCVGLLTSTSIFKEFPEGKLIWLADKATLSPPHNGLTVLDGAQEGSPACFTPYINGCGTD